MGEEDGSGPSAFSGDDSIFRKRIAALTACAVRRSRIFYVSAELSCRGRQLFFVGRKKFGAESMFAGKFVHVNRYKMRR